MAPSLLDFKPINSLRLPGIGELDCSGLVLVVGPNSSGKSQLLKDICGYLSGEPRELVVAKEIRVSAIQQEALLECLESEGHILKSFDENDQAKYQPRVPLIGASQSVPMLLGTTLQQYKAKSHNARERKRKNEYLSWFSHFLLTALFLEKRLTALAEVDTIDFENDTPANDLHALHLNKSAQVELGSEISRTFSKAVWTDAINCKKLCIRVNDAGEFPTHEDRLEINKMASYRKIETEGDGLKSYAATAVSLLLARRPVSVIDEPEICLHPPQAYNLGQFIGKHGTSRTTATFVATHSSQLLRGILHNTLDVKIVRLVRGPQGFRAKLVDAALLTEVTKKPTITAEAILDGLFSLRFQSWSSEERRSNAPSEIVTVATGTVGSPATDTLRA